MIRNCAMGTLLAALTFAGSARLLAQDSAPEAWQEFLVPAGETVYDVVNHVTWLAEVNLPAKRVPVRSGLPLCDVTDPEPADPCVNASRSMNYTSAVAWVKGMNDADYLGHHDWQLLTTRFTDPGPGCGERGPPSNSFAFECDANALGYLYHLALGFQAPNTAIPIPPNEVGPFNNFQTSRY